ncbi:Tubulin polyglutamylase complex subunit 2 [Tupaia chinensis]|uniref:Tubulin polyglutamylase complex subunit 2 n=1 Tax=Tupaia chinensis TaxID=246437 RepID=L9KQ46_TUPCH|nr:Tubulin polyglutamylase complex subunit 2 [Tupaia chinensis]
MPEDMKNFYLMTNGFHMTWSVKLDEHIIPLGSMAINSISKLTQLNQSSMYALPNAPTLEDLEDDIHEDTFTAYYRLLITHLGLPQWQYAFTSYGISPQAKQWFSMYKPITYNTNLLAEETDCFVNKLDPSKVFKSKNKILIPKKKGPVQPVGGQKGPPGPSTSKSSSGSGNPVRK